MCVPEQPPMLGKRSPKRLKFESLEDRRVLAGMVTASAFGGVLNITGDVAGNGVVVHNTSAGVVQVLGIDHAGSATGVNEQTSASFTNIKSIVIDMKGGDNAVVVTHLTLTGAGSILATSGTGNDFFGLGQFDHDGAVDDAVDALVGALVVNGNITVGTGIGNNTVLGGDVTTKVANFTAGSGNDIFKLEGQGASGDPGYFPGFTATAGLILSTGDGINTVSLKRSNVQSLTIPLGNGDDGVEVQDVAIAKGTSIAGKDGVNTITFERVTSKSLSVSLGVGNDIVTLDEVTTTKGISIDDSFGDDSVTLDHVELKSLSVSLGIGDDELLLDTVTASKSIDISAGAGADQITLDGVIASSLSITLGAGNDTLSLDDVTITKTTSISGGADNDTVDIDVLSAKKLDISLGDGDDDLSLQHVPVVGKARIDGGKGVNSYTDLGDNSFGQLKLTNFPTTV
jgi:hypothetical protein